MKDKQKLAYVGLDASKDCELACKSDPLGWVMII